VAKKPDRQLNLFGGTDTVSKAASTPTVETFDDPSAREIAARLPDFIKLGTSSWTFPGWGGIVYAGAPSQSALVANGLGAYARHPLMRTVGIDRSYYAPLTREELAGYAAQLPPRYTCVSKVWDEITTFAFPKHPRYGARGGTKNPRFLDPQLTMETVIGPYADAFADHAGPFVFEIPPMPRGNVAETQELALAIDRLLGAMPKRFSYAFELRNRELLTRDYFDVLRAHGAAHVLNYWTAMPSVGAQLDMDAITGDVVVARLMLAPGAKYEDSKERFAPFDRIVDAQPEMRADVVRLAKACARAGKTLFIIVNNKAEGSSPLTVRALAEAIANALA
jgi:uncharacterized protein YecE (DUF72 family)